MWDQSIINRGEGRKEMFYLMMQSTHFIYSYKRLPREREETCCCHMGYTFQLAARVIYMHHPTVRIAHHSLCYTGCGALAGMRNS